MSVKVYKRNGLYRVVEIKKNQKYQPIAKSKNSKAMDGGGHYQKNVAMRQAAHINNSKRRNDGTL